MAARARKGAAEGQPHGAVDRMAIRARHQPAPSLPARTREQAGQCGLLRLFRFRPDSSRPAAVPLPRVVGGSRPPALREARSPAASGRAPARRCRNGPRSGRAGPETPASAGPPVETEWTRAVWRWPTPAGTAPGRGTPARRQRPPAARPSHRQLRLRGLGFFPRRGLTAGVHARAAVSAPVSNSRVSVHWATRPAALPGPAGSSAAVPLRRLPAAGPRPRTPLLRHASGRDPNRP